MKIILLFITVLVNIINCDAQKVDAATTVGKKEFCLCCGQIGPKKMPTLFVNGKIYGIAYFSAFNAEDIVKLEIFRNGEGDPSLYHGLTNGAYSITLKKGIALMPMDKLLKKLKLKKTDISLPVYFLNKVGIKTKIITADFFIGNVKDYTLTVVDAAAKGDDRNHTNEKHVLFAKTNKVTFL